MNPAFELQSSTVLRATRDAAVAIDEDHHIVLFNPAAEQMFGRSSAEMLGRPIDQLIPPERRRAHATMMRAFGASNATELSMHERRPVAALRADGTTFPVAATISRATAMTPAGARTIFLAMLHDISEQVGLHTELARATARVRALIELAPVATSIVERRCVVSVNRACAQLFGLAPAMLAGRDLPSLIDASSAVAVTRACALALARPGRTARAEGTIVRADGGKRQVEVIVTALPANDGDSLQVAFVDQTRRHAETKALHRSRSELRALAARGMKVREDERRVLSRELHDDLGQRLTAIKMVLAAQGDAACATPAGSADFQRLAAMVDDAVSAVRRISADLRPTILDDLGLFAAIEWLGRNAARRLDIDITLDLPPDEPELTPESSIAVFRIVQESLTNAASHASARQAFVHARRAEDHLVVTVRDNGIGFPRFTTGEPSSFGLLGMRERANMVGGQIEFDNPEGGGARVVVRVPLASRAGTGSQSGRPGRPPR